MQYTIEHCICKIALWINAQFVNLLTILFFIIENIWMRVDHFLSQIIG